MSYDRDKAWEMVAALLRSDGYDDHTLEQMKMYFDDIANHWPGWPETSSGLSSQHAIRRKKADIERAMLRLGEFLRTVNGIEDGDEQAD